MQIILLEKVANVGNLGDLVKVKDGFARNFLIPKGMAKRATPENKKLIEEKRAELERTAADKLAAAQALGEKLEGTMRSAERETRDAYLGVLAEKARVQALSQAVKSSQTALEATEAGFEVGTRTTVDVLDARRRLFEAQRDYARSRYDYLINIVRLESASGGLKQDDLDAINGFLTQPTTLPVVRPKS